MKIAKLLGILLLFLGVQLHVRAQCPITASITALGPTSFCQGGGATLVASPYGGYMYQWYLNATPISGATNDTFTATSGGYYSVYISNMSCSASANISLTANPLPVVTLGALNNLTNLCTGDTAHLYVSSCNMCTYQWRKNGMAIPGLNATTCNTTPAGNYNCMVTNQLACVDSASTPITITTNTTPLVSVTAANTNYNHICHGDTANLTITASPCNACTYQWYINALAINGATSPSLTIDSAASYNCQVSNANCTGALTAAYTLFVDTIPLAVITPSSATLCTGDTVTIKDTISGFGLTYQWYMNYNQILGTLDSIRVAGGFGATYTFKCFVYDNNGCWDSSNAAIIYDIQSPILPASGSNQVCIGDTLALNITGYPSTVTYSWVGPNAFSSSTMAPIVTNAMSINDTGMYICHAANNSCYTNDTFYITAACLDSVWPGDVNLDHFVDNQDALDLTLGYGATGYARPAASINWVGQWCHDWNAQIVNGVNMKHGDCDGNDTVNANDTAAIAANYGNYHPKQTQQAQAKITGLPDLYFDVSGINLSAGTTVSIPIKLGTAAIPLNNITGLATQIILSGINFTTAPQLSFANSWLGNGTNTYSFRKAVNNNRLDWAFARNDHQNISGYGTIATLILNIPANANPQQLLLHFANTRIINNGGQALSAFNIVDDTANISPTGIQQLENIKAISTIIPNPSSADASLQSEVERDAFVQMQLTNIMGQEIWHYNTQLSAGLNLNPLPQNLKPGVYLLSIKVANQKPDIIRWIVK